MSGRLVMLRVAVQVDAEDPTACGWECPGIGYWINRHMKRCMVAGGMLRGVPTGRPRFARTPECLQSEEKP